MESFSELIARIRQVCIASAQNPSILSHLLRHPLRRLLDYSGAVALLQFERTPAYLFGLNTPPRFIRALRLAARTVKAGTIIDEIHAQGVAVVCSRELRAISLGRHLRPLASGDFLVCGYVDSARLSRSTFAFSGVRLRDIEQLKSGIKTIAPYLHETLLNSALSERPAVPGLTPAEDSVYRLLSDGLSNKEIAKILNKSDATIRNQLHAIFVKLGVGTRTEAVARQHERVLALSSHPLVPADRVIVVYE